MKKNSPLNFLTLASAARRFLRLLTNCPLSPLSPSINDIIMAAEVLLSKTILSHTHNATINQAVIQGSLNYPEHNRSCTCSQQISTNSQSIRLHPNCYILYCQYIFNVTCEVLKFRCFPLGCTAAMSNLRNAKRETANGRCP